MSAGVLFSFSEKSWRRTDVAAWRESWPMPLSLMLDSGAYSVMTRGQEISLDDYGRFVVEEGGAFDVVANLDVIRDPETTWRNQQRLEGDYGLSPMPVFHAGDDRRWLKHYLDHYPYIGLGGVALVRGAENRVGWVARCMAMSADHRFHLLGVTDRATLMACTPHSADATSWVIRGRKFGLLNLWDGRQIVRAQRRETYRHAALVREHYGDPAVCMSDNGAMWQAELAIVNGIGWLRFADWLAARRHRPFTLYLATQLQDVERLRQRLVDYEEVPA